MFMKIRIELPHSRELNYIMFKSILKRFQKIKLLHLGFLGKPDKPTCVEEGDSSGVLYTKH